MHSQHRLRGMIPFIHSRERKHNNTELKKKMIGRNGTREAKIREAKVSPELSPHPQHVPNDWIIYEFIWWGRKFRSKKCWN